MWNYIYQLIMNNIFYVVPILGIFITMAIQSTKIRSIVISFFASIILVTVLFILNKYSLNNNDLRSMLVTIITTYCNAFQLIVYGFILNMHILQLGLALGLTDLLYGFTMGNVLLAFIYYFHITFRITFKRVNLYVLTAINTKFAYLKKIILNSFGSSFLQVMRV